jgi:hypothetical protein
MKTTFVRTAVMTLAFAGFIAPSVARKASAKPVSAAKVLSTSSSFVGYPAPMCLPSSGNYCGLQ